MINEIILEMVECNKSGYVIKAEFPFEIKLKKKGSQRQRRAMTMKAIN